MARDKNNNPVAVDSPDAVKFCAMGALCKVTPNQGPEFSDKLLRAQRICFRKYDVSSLSSVNDLQGREYAIEVLKELEDEEP
jgi:hypothetical protein